MRDELAWRITYAAEAAQRFAHRLNRHVPTPGDRDRFFDAGLAGGAGDFQTMARLGATVDMVARAADRHQISYTEAFRRAEPRRLLRVV